MPQYCSLDEAWGNELTTSSNKKNTFKNYNNDTLDEEVANSNPYNNNFEHFENFEITDTVYDSTNPWTLAEARNFLSEVEKFDIEMIEQPLSADNIKGHAELRKSISIPVMLDESIHSSRDLLNVIEMNAADYVNIKLLKTGGLFPAKELASICSAAGIYCQIGSLDSSIGSAAAVNLVHSCPIFKYAEINGPSRFKNDFASGFQNISGQAVLDKNVGLGIKMTLKEEHDE